MITDRIIPQDIKEKIKILVVEDNLLCRKLIMFLLKNWGFQHDVCANGKLAIENIKLNKYDLILMDIRMPEMDGYETAKCIRGEMGLGLPIIAITSHSSDEERSRCLIAGIDDYITKPLKEEELYNIAVNYLYTAVVENKENKLKQETPDPGKKSIPAE